MSKIYKIEVEEILQNVYPVKAKSLAEAIDKVKEKYKDNTVLLVTHGGTTRAIEAYFNGLNKNNIMPPETIKNCEIREYEYK